MIRKFNFKNSILALFILVASTTYSQLEQGKILADAYLMGPTANTYGQFIWPNAFDKEGYRRVGSTIGFGVRAEYMLLDKLSIGLDGNYAFGGYQYRDTYYDIQTNTTTNSAKYIAKYTKLRALIMSNFYFLNREKYSLYTGIGIGYYTRSETYTIDGNSVSSFGNVFLSDQNLLVPLGSVAGRIRFGAKFFFSEHVGAMVELGLGGGAAIEFGVATKF